MDVLARDYAGRWAQTDPRLKDAHEHIVFEEPGLPVSAPTASAPTASAPTLLRVRTNGAYAALSPCHAGGRAACKTAASLHWLMEPAPLLGLTNRRSAC